MVLNDKEFGTNKITSKYSIIGNDNKFKKNAKRRNEENKRKVRC